MQVGQSWLLILMAERQEKQVKPFNAVAAEIEAQMRQEAQKESRTKILEVLRGRANIRAVDAPPKPEPETQSEESVR